MSKLRGENMEENKNRRVEFAIKLFYIINFGIILLSFLILWLIIKYPQLHDFFREIFTL
ncbi:hypothetical protein [Bacillus sp. cl95]|uniref:hypothetical protein n=2 Tax=unclassified Bacillus (in: firmicutes) TaxID=185979 RepID=UPI001C31620C|nr:hypothetical protein [Bacillus sp. cl95]